MPLRDHFRPPLDDRHDPEGFLAGWPAVVALSLSPILPQRYAPAPRIVPAAPVEPDVVILDEDELDTDNESGGSVPEGWAPGRPTLTVATDLPSQDDYEVRIYDAKRGRRLVAAIEIVSPANKNRPEHRAAFAAKCAALLQERVSVTIIDLVTTRNFNLYQELLDLAHLRDPALGNEPPSLYAVACRATKQGKSWLLETWLHPLSLGQPLPAIPLWLADNLAVPLVLEASYEATCRGLRIP